MKLSSQILKPTNCIFVVSFLVLVLFPKIDFILKIGVILVLVYSIAKSLQNSSILKKKLQDFYRPTSTSKSNAEAKNPGSIDSSKYTTGSQKETPFGKLETFIHIEKRLARLDLVKTKRETNFKMNVFYAIIKLFEDLVHFFLKKEDFITELFYRSPETFSEVCAMLDCFHSIATKLRNLKHALKFGYEDFEKHTNDYYFSRVLKNKNVLFY